MAAKHLVIVPHTHWDREWYMPFERFRKRLVSMMDHLLEVLEHEREFKYFELDGQTIVLLDYLAIRPENESRLLKFIRRGRIIIGPWYVQPDEFLVSGESLIRNLRMGIETAAKFGKPSMIGYMPDQFGHIAQMPQILAGFGMRSAVVWRGVGDTVKQTQFLWESPDGTRVFTVYLADSYSNGAFLPLKPAELRKRLYDLIERQRGFSDIESILIMNGLDHLEPQDGISVQLEKAVRRMPGVTFEMGNLGTFIKQAREQASKQADSLSVHRGEFRSSERVPLIPGVTSARMSQKQRDFRNCRLLEKYVEPLCAWAALCGDKRPHRNFIEHAWRLTVENHPHDSICGCSVDAVHEEMETRFERVRQTGRALQRDALSFLAGCVDSSWVDPDGPALCVYNPTGVKDQVVDVVVGLEEPDFVRSVGDRHGRTLPMQKTVGERELFIAMQDTPGAISEIVAGTEGRELMGFFINNIFWRLDGNVLKLDIIMARAPSGEVDFEKRKRELLDALSDPTVELVDVRGISGARTRLSFFAGELSPFGLNVYSLSHQSSALAEGADLMVSPERMENGFYLISVNEDGTLDIADKQSGAEFRRCLKFIDEGDRGDSYNFDEVPGGEIMDCPSERVRTAVVETGPVRATLRLEFLLRIPERLTPERDARAPDYVDTKLVTFVSIYRDVKRIDFRTELDNNCEDHRLRVVFNAPFAAPEVLVESSFGIVRRASTAPSGEGYFEKPSGTGPQKTFACVENSRLGMALFNRGIPEIEAAAGADQTALKLTLLRSIGWLSRDDLKSRPAAAGPQFETPGAQSKGPHTFEYAFTSYQGGCMEADIVRRAHSYAFPPIAAITGRHKGKLKKSASLVGMDEPGVVVSAIESCKNKKGYLVRMYNAADSTQRARLAVWGRKVEIHEVDFLEKRMSKAPLRRKGGKVELSFRPAEIKTLRVLLGQ